MKVFSVNKAITQFNPSALLSTQKLAQARAHLDAGRYAEARELYRAIGLPARDAMAVLLGLAEVEIYTDHPQEGLAHLQQALQIDPLRAEAHSLAAVALLDLRAYDKVLIAADAALKSSAGDLRARVTMATALYYLGRYDQAREEIALALAAQGDHVPSLITSGLIEQGSGNLNAAALAYSKVLTLNPNSFSAHLNLSAIFIAQGRAADALSHAEQALALRPGSVASSVNRSAALVQLSRFDEALEEADRILVQEPKNVQARQHRRVALLNLGRVDEARQEERQELSVLPRDSRDLVLRLDELMERTRFADALGMLEAGLEKFGLLPPLLERKAELLFMLEEFEAAKAAAGLLLERDPANPRAAVTISGCCLELGADQEALNWAEKACETASPPTPNALLARAAALAMGGRFTECERDLREVDGRYPEVLRSLADKNALKPIPCDRIVAPVNPYAWPVTTYVQRYRRCDWRSYPASFMDLLDRAERARFPSPIPPYRALLLPLTGMDQLRVSRAVSDDYERALSATRLRCDFRYPSGAPGRLRVGYVSPDFRAHAVNAMVKDLFRYHDRARIEVFAYALYPGGGKDRDRVRAGVDHFVELAGMSNEDAAKRINADGIHILVDMAGYTEHARSDIFVLRPAPLQLSYMGFPGTTGAPWLDYVVATPGLIPPTCESFYTEQPIRLPGTHIACDGFEEEGATTREEYGLPAKGTIFACFQREEKYDPETFSCWMRILQRVPESVLWLYVEPRSARKHLLTEAEHHNILPERIVFADTVAIPKHIARQRLADLFLDTPQYSGITTVSMALWAGLPVLTLPRDSYASRMGAAGLEALGVTETIVASLEEYEERAVQLGNDPVALKALRTKVENARAGCALFNAEATVRSLEFAYETIWRRHVDGEAPSPLDVPVLAGSGAQG